MIDEPHKAEPLPKFEGQFSGRLMRSIAAAAPRPAEAKKKAKRKQAKKARRANR